MKGELRAKREALENLWRQGLSGQVLLDKHTRMMDDYLAADFNKSSSSRNMALVALGGYGRAELFPFSDIDIMLLHLDEPEEKLKEVAEAVFYPLWDAGLEVGHGVRTPDTCLSEAKKDFFLEVSLLDARLLAGSKTLFNDLREKLSHFFIEGKRRHFINNMLEHRSLRHQRFGNHSYLLEPHIKESRGGFRDIQAMLWTARVVFGLNDLEAMADAGLLSAEEQINFAEAWDNLIRIRNRLHYICGRKNDQLYFEYQEEMATAFGYKNSQGLLAVENFMRDVHRHLQIIAVTSDLFFEHVNEVLHLGSPQHPDKKLEKGLEIRGDKVIITSSTVITERPYMLMRVFVQSAHNNLPLHHRTRKLVHDNLDLIDDRLRKSRRMAHGFIDILLNCRKPMTVLGPMLETGLLGAYIPEFRNLESLAQHDIYHVFTVDRHLLQTVAEIRRLEEEEKTVFQKIASPHILYLAALLHDIGKGHLTQHSEYGAELVGPISNRLGLDQAESNCLSFLIREHLFLPDTAMRRDLEDENLILRCAARIKDPDRLAMLYLLTIADARATGPTVWTEWKAALLLELFLKIAHQLDHFEPDASNQNNEAAWMREQVAQRLGNFHFDLDRLPDDYLLNFTPDEVVSHIYQRDELKRRQILLAADNHGGHWTLLIMTHDRPGLLNKICGVLALHQLTVLAAHISTWQDGTVVDTMEVSPIVNREFADQDWERLKNDLHKAINFQLGLPHRLEMKLCTTRGCPNSKMKSGARVKIDTGASDIYTVIEVFAEDKPGQLYHITRTLFDFGINTFKAKISSEGDQVVDVFYVLDYEGKKIENPGYQQEIHQGLLYAVS